MLNLRRRGLWVEMGVFGEGSMIRNIFGVDG